LRVEDCWGRGRFGVLSPAGDEAGPGWPPIEARFRLAGVEEPAVRAYLKLKRD